MIVTSPPLQVTPLLAKCTLFLLTVIYLAPTTNGQDDSQAKFTPEQLEAFETNIRPLLIKHCYQCHSSDSRPAKGGLLLDSREGLLTGGDSGTAIVPGNPEESLLISSVKYQSYEMPPDGKLSEKEVELLEQWIANNAPWPASEAPSASNADRVVNWREAQNSHWSFQPVLRPKFPDVSDTNWPETGIDYFILAELDNRHLAPSAEADRRTLIRRLYIDLLGVPPTQLQVDTFITSDSPQAYAELVDELLSSPYYGEKWGRHWLDVARYNDCLLYTSDAADE